MEATTSAAASTSPSSSESIISSLITRGWHFRDADQIQLLITAHLSPNCTVDSIESELVNMDLRSIGGKCLPQPSSIGKVSHLQGPIVLQVCSSRDISRSSIVDVSENSGNRRLLRLKLTDGHSEITAVEYHHVPSIPDDMSPGTKVRLQNKADICSGILCLNKRVISVIGGLVQSLYEEWQLKRKYLNVSRQNLRLLQENASSYPPPFEKLQIQAPGWRAASVSHTSATKGMHSSLDTSGTSGTSLNDRIQSSAAKGESSNLSHNVQLQKIKATVDSVTDEVKLLNTIDENTEKATSSSSRPKVTASVPVQNQMAAQKLLQKTTQPNYTDRNSRSHRRRGKYEEEDSSVITLDEWERRKTGIDPPTVHEHSHFSRDEDLARQRQEQFDLEDNHAQNDPHMMEAKNITMSMFNFERDDARASGKTEFRGRGRGRGRGRRGGGRGRF
ncbi:hypothetical protein ACS0TY_024104 [Phlomoides rotata]